ncbi:molybdopterin-dependent oxidoreductase [Seleniivibrio woodruffii]|uniref:molybdopterin-dependent oxidoreductase n=1 Tax=Seleniivibrio woodruffii TaxID=1078050 RepID=UPI00240A1B30|nr:molybdopterin-dependent oxidoreductase [Seleniivibrio woodruffii]
MSFKEKLLNSTSFTRRTFLKGASVAGATAALYGCGGGGGGKTIIEEDATVEVPKITEKIIAGATPHNCGGRCVSRYYVKDGVIKRIVTDERPDKSIAEGDEPQYRSCVRCRSRKQWFYRKDRLLYPLKQTGNRGDINGFVRISWEQAYAEIAEKIKSIKAQYGPEAFHIQYASGDVTGWSSGAISRLLNMCVGGYTNYYLSYSSPSLQHVARFVDGPSFSNPLGNSKQDAMNADNLVLWSCNYHESIIGTNSGWYLQQIKESGVPITAVDVRVSKSVATVVDDFVDVEPATDAALVLAMLYRIVKERYDDLDVSFIQNYVFGFFDTGNTLLHADAGAGYGNVPAGGSLSAFILGNDNFLVGKGLNTATSIYPNTIGYEVNTEDPLYGKTVSIWGQLPKTPEWAEKITGVPAAKIRKMADMYLDTKVTTWSGLGYNRGAESEQVIWILRILSAVTKNFGISGAAYGRNSNNYTAALPGTGLGTGVTNTVNLTNKIYDSSRLTAASKYVTTATRNLSVFTIPDAIENGGYAGKKSKWNDGQVNKLTTPFKAIFTCGGNITYNQHSGASYSKEIFADKSKLELIVNMDAFMTGSATLADYVLPVAMAGEKPGAANIWDTGEVAIKMNVIVTPPGEAKDEYTICAGIADKFGSKAAFLAGYAEGVEGMEARMKDSWNAANMTTTYGMTYDEWSEKGVVSVRNKYTSQAINFKAFRADPVASPLGTPSGKFEAYCLSMMEDYEARYHENIDTSTTDAGGVATLYNAGAITSKYHGASTARRFVYPIPMYIPMSEGRHAIDDIDPSDPLCHDDPLGLTAKGYKFNLLSWHLMYRSHSTLNNVAYLDECYKKDINGNPAYLDPNRNFRDGVWDNNVYEPVWINSADAQELGIANGNRVLVESSRGKLYASAVVTNRAPRKTICMGQGGWISLNANGIDVGGCVSTVTSPRPSRICKGNNCATDCRVKITKA